MTGATGVVGGALLRRLVAGGDEVVALARSAEAADALARAGVPIAESEGFAAHAASMAARMRHNRAR